MNKKDPALLRTQFSIQAQDLAKTFGASLGKMRIAPGDYVPELTSPEGPSTGGGVQALQRLRLVAQKQGFPTLVVGSVNQKDGTAEIRSYEHVDAIHHERFHRPVALDRAQYEAFIGMASNFLGVVRLKIDVTGPPAVISPDASAGYPAAVEPRATSGKLVVVAILLAAAVVTAVVVWLFVIRK